MGSCLCKQRRRRRERGSAGGSANSDSVGCRNDRFSRTREQRGGRRTSADVEDSSFAYYDGREAAQVGNDVRDLIRQTLRVIRLLVNNDQEPPPSLLKLNMIADKEKGWQIIVKSLIETIPDDDSLGPAVITLFLDECPLPSKDAVHRLLFHLKLGSSDSNKKGAAWHRNACIVLGSLAEKLAGSSSVGMCNQSTLHYLIANLKPTSPKQVILFSLLALEKFAQTSENQLMIARTLESLEPNPLKVLEKWQKDVLLHDDWLAQQVGFCAQWSLDNIFLSSNRAYSYESTDVMHIDAMLNHEDVSEYLKIGPNGLEARCDVSSFESVRCTFEVHEGVWYYEAKVLTPGVMQIGFATKRSRFLNHEGYGIGDDDSSVAYDGCRQLLWHNANSTRHEHPAWQPGDVVGCLLQLDDPRRGNVLFFLNGVALKNPHVEFIANLHPEEGVFAAASFMSFQQCRFNFGANPFKFPPKDVIFRTFNDGGSTLTLSQKTILPRRRRLEQLQKEPIPEDSCNICFAATADTILNPCMHGGLCATCSRQVEQCPLCRTAIETRVTRQSFTTRRLESSI